MIYKILSESKAKRYSYKKDIPKTVIISIVDIGERKVRFSNNRNIKRILRLSFEDTENAKNFGAFTKQQALEIKDFIERIPEDTEQILVHCYAGISRSSAVIATLKRLREGDDSDIWGNESYRPNHLVYKKLMHVYGVEVTDSECFRKDGLM